MAVLDSPHLETVTPQMLSLLGWLGSRKFMRHFYLGGGTALALQLGHRRSVNLDFFSEIGDVDIQTCEQIISNLAKQNCQVITNANGNLQLLVNDIHVGFFRKWYVPLDLGLQFKNVRLASLLDLGLLKLDALAGDGCRKDIIDLYVLCQAIPIDLLLQAAERKYPHERDFVLLSVESTHAFDTADRDIPPDMLVDVPWDEVKVFFIAQVKQLAKIWLY